MDRNQFIGLALILGLIFIWTMYMEPPNDAKLDNKRTEKKADAPQAPPSTAPTAPEAPKDTVAERETRLRERYGPFYKFADPEANREEKIEVVTEKLKIAFSNKGARPTVVFLNEYRTYDSLPLPLMLNRPENLFDFTFNAQGKVISTSELYFLASAKALNVKGRDAQTLTFSAPTDAGTLEIAYTFAGDEYNVDMDVKLINLNEAITDDSYLFRFSNMMPLTEKAAQSMNPEVKLCWRYSEDDEVESTDGADKDTLVERTPASLKWLAFKSQFFSMGVVAKEKFNSGAVLKQKPFDPTVKSEFVKKLGAEMYVPYGHRPNETHKFTLFFVPNDYNLLKKYDLKLERIVNLGWGPIKYITMLIIGIFGFLERFFSSYGVIIALLAVIIKIVLSPLTYRSYVMGAKMQVINKMPEMQAIDAKHKDNPTKLQQEKMAFYREIGFNPFAGCVPALLQMPILFAMLSFFPHSIDLRQKSFLWAEDLSTYDSVWTFGYVPIINSIYGDHVSLFALLMTISTLAFTYIQQQSQPVSANTPAALKYMPYFFPFIFLSVLNNYSSGLSYYYFVLNLLTIVQTIVIKLTLNEDKIRAAIQANKKKLAGKAAKPGRLQKWMMENQKRLEEQQRQAQKRGRK